MPDKPNVLVVGSINMDMVVRCPQMPQPGETVLGNGFATNPGGKGANQAVAAARLGGQVTMLGAVGDDGFGRCLTRALRDEGIDADAVRTCPGAPTGVAMILVDAQGENSIVVASGANHHLTPDDVFEAGELFARADVVLVQLELTLPTVRAAVDIARRNRCKVVLDPAPAPRSLPEALCMVDVISPNVSEAEIITGRTANEERMQKMVAMDLLARGAKAAVLKLGGRGSMVVDAESHFYRVKPYRVDVVDTTAAGDAFTAALAVAMASGQRLREAARFANAAGALACTRLGALPAMPTASEVQMLMADQAPDDL